jgi:hypothetical protein
MQEPYVKGSIDPPRPRVMAACPQGHVASVNRGTRRPAIEFRNHPFRGAPRIVTGKATGYATIASAGVLRDCEGRTDSDILQSLL